MPARERAALLAEADMTVLPAGSTLGMPGEPVSTAYFPDSGVIAYISEMTTGRQVAVAAIGVEGIVGAGRLIGIERHPYRVVALLDSAGYRIPSDTLRRAFDDYDAVHTAALAHFGQMLTEVTSLVACSRMHSHRQRVARWLLMTMDKAHETSLRVTHDVVSQMVGGPRHAVTVALNELGEKGALAHLRGRIDILDRSLLVAQACECYPPPRNLIDSVQPRE